MSNNSEKIQNSQGEVFLNLVYVNGKYKIKIISARNNNIKELLQNTFKIEKIYLEANDNESNKTFPIKETIKVIAKIYNNKNITCKTETEYIKIFNSKKNHYLQFSLDGRSNNKFLLSIGLVVYELDCRYYGNYYGTYYQIFKASKTILDPNLLDVPLKHLNYDDTNIKNISKQYQTEQKVNRSKSLIVPDFKFSNKFEEIKKEKSFSISDIKDIPNLTKLISNKLFGLRNLGNTCFLNSSLQILIHSPLFIEKFLEDIQKLKPSYNTLVYEFFNLIMNIKSIENNIFSPDKLISSFLKQCDLFSLGQQSDSQRFYRNLATIFDKEFGPYNTCIKDIFKGNITYITEYFCSNSFCDYKETNSVQQPFYDLIVSVGEKDSAITELIDSTYKTQVIISAKKCNKCGSNLELIRHSKIKPNKYLSINIQRGKIATRTLRNNLITIDNIYLEGKYFYEPYAVNFHTGTMDYGHYYR